MVWVVNGWGGQGGGVVRETRLVELVGNMIAVCISENIDYTSLFSWKMRYMTVTAADF